MPERFRKIGCSWIGVTFVCSHCCPSIFLAAILSEAVYVLCFLHTVLCVYVVGSYSFILFIGFCLYIILSCPAFLYLHLNLYNVGTYLISTMVVNSAFIHLWPMYCLNSV